jgi:hypothetical protein
VILKSSPFIFQSNNQTHSSEILLKNMKLHRQSVSLADNGTGSGFEVQCIVPLTWKVTEEWRRTSFVRINSFAKILLVLILKLNP